LVARQEEAGLDVGHEEDPAFLDVSQGDRTSID
jgi:hypothetical protein